MVLERLIHIAGRENVAVDEPMDRHTTFRAGGRAAYFVTVTGEKELSGLLRFLQEQNMPYFLLGNGSNILVRDSGYDGVVISMGEEFAHIAVSVLPDGTCRLEAGAAAMLSKVARTAAGNGFTGMETLSGIPGTIGGAVTMNAGAYGGEIKDIIDSATVMNRSGELLELKKDELALSYRHSIIQDKDYVVIRAVFGLREGDKEEIESKIAEYTRARREKQPLEFPSAGSTFKRPEGYFAGKLIMDAGLRGYRVGGAMVSEKHCGFIINADHASADDIVQVIEDVKVEVMEKFGIELEPEVKILG